MSYKAAKLPPGIIAVIVTAEGQQALEDFRELYGYREQLGKLTASARVPDGWAIFFKVPDVETIVKIVSIGCPAPGVSVMASPQHLWFEGQTPKREDVATLPSQFEKWLTGA